MSKGAYQSHPAAEIFPLMNEAALKELADDIKANGLLEPIILHEGRILDGRNRNLACDLAGVPPRYEPANINGHSPTLYVVSKNLHRRHLTTDQKVDVALKIEPLLAVEAARRKHEGQVRGGKAKALNHTASCLSGNLPPKQEATENKRQRPYKSSEVAASAAGVSEKTVRRAKKLRQRDPAEYGRVVAGQTTLAAAFRKVVLKKEEKPPAPERKKLSNRFGNAARRRMVEGLSTAHGLCTGISRENVPVLLPALTDEERKYWAGMARECARMLRTFARALEGETQ